MLHHRSPEKAKRYLDLLDAARCNGKWEDVPELVRKVAKHAPQRKCLTAVARSESEIVKASSKGLPARLQHLIPELSKVIENEKTYPEDVFQAQTCLAWIYWIEQQHKLAAAVVPSSLPSTVDPTTEKQGTLREWTQVCIFKCAYIGGASQEIIGTPSEALKVYDFGLSYTMNVNPTMSGGLEYTTWIERFLTRFCMLSHRQSQLISGKSGKPQWTIQPETALTPFRAWARFWENNKPAGGIANAEVIDGKVRRRDVWQAYYMILSKILQSGSAYAMGAPNLDPIASNASVSQGRETIGTRIQQYTELNRVERIYENLLLKEVPFPEAGMVNFEVDNWVDQVMANWRVICGPTWQDDDLGQEGQEAAGRKVLDILYRAATRTFHSTSLLRHLFTVHASLAEFDLASSALDSYLEIVGKGKAREAKSGQAEVNLDDDETVLRTITTGISMLCTFGRRKEAEKAQDLGCKLQKWLEQHDCESPSNHEVNGATPDVGQDSQPHTYTSVSGPTFAAAYRAVGVSQAHWAHMTFETSKRTELQAMAIENLRMALQSKFEDEENVETLYSLALILAETRDLDGAIACIKFALSMEPQELMNDGAYNEYTVDRPNRSNVTDKGRLIKMWHLMALLLSTRQDFDKAQDACEAAMDSFTDYRLSEGNSQSPSLLDMSLYEKQNLVELKLTQLALAEVNDGPEVAINGGGELLSLYSKLFHYPEIAPNQLSAQRAPPPTNTTNGTIRGLKGSIFGRSKDATINRGNRTAVDSVRSNRFSAEMAEAPSISITDNDMLPPPGHHSHHLFHRNSKKLQKRNSKKSLGSTRGSRLVSTAQPNTADASSTSMSTSRSWNSQANVIGRSIGEPGVTNGNDRDDVGVALSHDISPESGSSMAGLDRSVSASQPLPPMAHNYHHTLHPAPVGHPDQPPEQDMRLPTGSPSSSSAHLGPRFAKLEQQRQVLSLLLKVWLLISGLYRRAKLYDDAQGALDEAFKHVKSIEIAVADQDSSAQAFEQPGWGGVKCVEELWADVYTEKGNLCLARSETHEAMVQYESALAHFPDHPAATVSLSNLLLDIYTKVIPPQPDISILQTTQNPALSFSGDKSKPILASLPSHSLPPRASRLSQHHPVDPTDTSPSTPTTSSSSSDAKTPEGLDRLAARDRAYGLLSSLTKLGSGWDNSEAWFALGRAYEESGQLERAKEVLWWVVELEEKRPIRGWTCLGWGGGL